MDSSILITDKQAIKAILKEAIAEVESERKKTSIQLYSVHKVAKMLQRSDKTIVRLIQSKAIRTTPDGKIPGDALDEYLQNS